MPDDRPQAGAGQGCSPVGVGRGGDRDVRTAALFVRSDRDQLARLVAMVDAGWLSVPVAETLPFSELASVHARSEAGGLRGKVVLTPPAGGAG